MLADLWSKLNNECNVCHAHMLGSISYLKELQTIVKKQIRWRVMDYALHFIAVSLWRAANMTSQDS